jgi:hypothetical protein
MEGPFEHDDERILPTQPGASLQPPGRVPPVAVGAGTPDEEPARRVTKTLHARGGQIRPSDIPRLITWGLQRVMRSAARALVHR